MSDIDVLQYEALIGAYETIKETPLLGIDTFAPTMEDVVGDVAKWDEFTDARLADAKLRSRGAPSRSTNLENMKARSNQMPYFNESFLAAGDDLNNLRQPGSDARDKLGKKFLARNLGKLKAKERRTKELLLWRAFTGSLTFYLNDIAQTVTYAVNSADVSVSNPWDTAANNPLDNITVWRATIQEETGRVATRMFFNDTVAAALLANTQVQNLIGEGALTERIAQTGQIGRFGGLECVQYDGKHSSAKYIADKYVIITAEPDDADPWMAYQQGSVTIAEGDTMQEVPSPGLWTELTKDPVGQKVICKSCFLPVLIAPKAVYYAKVLA